MGPLKLWPCIDTEIKRSRVLFQWSKKRVKGFLETHDTKKNPKYLNNLLFLFLTESEASRNLPFMKMLLEIGADPLHKVEYGKSIAYHAFKKENNLEVAMLFLKHLPNVDAPLEIGGTTALHLFIKFQTADALNLILRLKPNLNKEDSKGMTPLVSACVKTEYKQVKYLLKAGADTNARSESGCIPIHSALKLGLGEQHAAIIHLLLETSDMSITNVDGDIPLHTLIENPKPHTPRFCRMMLAKGADPNAENSLGKTPLHYAARFRNYHSTEEVIEILLENGASINQQDFAGNTVLHFAAAGKHKPATHAFLTFLMDNKADPNIINNKNRTMFHCLKTVNAECILYVLKYLVLKEASGTFEFKDDLLQDILSHEMSNNYLEGCRTEIALFKSTIFGSKFHFSLFDALISAKETALVRCAKNEEYRNYMANFDIGPYPCYGKDLMFNFEMGMERYEAMQEAYAFFAIASRGVLNDHCIGLILDSLPTVDLKNLKVETKKVDTSGSESDKESF